MCDWNIRNINLKVQCNNQKYTTYITLYYRDCEYSSVFAKMISSRQGFSPLQVVKPSSSDAGNLWRRLRKNIPFNADAADANKSSVNSLAFSHNLIILPYLLLLNSKDTF